MKSPSNWPATGADGTARAVTSVSAVFALPATPKGSRQEDVLIDNPGPNDVYLRAGAADAVATTTSLRVPAGSLQPYRKGTATHVALVCAAGLTQAVVIHVGDGQ